MADYSGDSSGDESMEAAAGEAAAGEAAAGEAAVAGKKPRGAVVETIECPVCRLTIEITKVRTYVVQCSDCDPAVWVSYDWPENFGYDREQVTNRRKAHLVSLDLGRRAERARNARAKVKAGPKEKYDASLEANKARHKVRRLPGGDEEPTPESLAKRNADYKEKRSVGALAASDPELLEQVQRVRREKYERERDEGEAYFQRVRRGPPAVYNEYLRKMRDRSRAMATRTCSVCFEEFRSATYEWCEECRGEDERVKKKKYEIEVNAFFRENKMFCSLRNLKGECNGGVETNAFADFVFKSPGASNIVIVEVDENQHLDRTLECEIARMGKIRDQFAGESVTGEGTTGSSPGSGIVCIRYNPVLETDSNNGYKITDESKELLLDCVRQALESGPSESKLGYDQFFIGYDQSRVAMLLYTELNMHAEGLESFGSSSSGSSSSGSSSSPDTITDIVNVLTKHNDDFLIYVNSLKEKERKKRACDREAVRRADKVAKNAEERAIEDAKTDEQKEKEKKKRACDRDAVRRADKVAKNAEKRATKEAEAKNAEK